MPATPAPNGKAARAEPLGAGQRAPASEVEREDRGDADRVAGPQPHRPHDPGVRVGHGAPVVAPDGERGRPPGGAAGAVDMEYVGLGNAKIVAERRRPRLRGAQIFLLHDRDLRFKILKRLELRRVKPCFVPFVPVEGGVRVGVGADLLQAFENARFARRRGIVSRSRNQ